MPRNRIAKRCRLFLQIAALSAIGTMVSAQESVPAHLDYFGTGNGSTIICPPDPCPPGVPMLQSPQMVPPSMNNGMRIGDTQPNTPAQQPSTPGSQPNSGSGDSTPPNNTQPTQPQTDPNSNFNFDQNNDTSPLSQPTNNQPTPDFSRAGVGNFGAGGISGLAFADNPNVMGDFLNSSRNLSFFYNLAGDGNEAYSGGGTVARNTKLSDNNSPIPRNRVHFRYHYFDNSGVVSGLGTENTPFRRFPDLDGLGNLLEPVPNDPFAAPNPFGTVPPNIVLRDLGYTQFDVASRRRDMNTHFFEFGFETKISDLSSIEFRLPALVALDSQLNLDSTDPFAGGNFLFAEATPFSTLGNYDFELRDVSAITKTVLLHDRNWILSGGVGVRLPTSPTSVVQITDGVNIVGSASDFDGSNTFAPIRYVYNPDGSIASRPPGSGSITDSLLIVTDFRNRTLKTDYRSVSLTPYLSFGTGSDKSPWFTNSFGSVELPVGQDSVRYSESFLNVRDQGAPTANTVPVAGLNVNSFTGVNQVAYLQDQTLLSLDASVGRWLYSSPRSKWVRRLALISELHYTTTLNDADTVSFNSAIDLDGDGIPERNIDVPVALPGSGLLPGQVEPATIVGNTANRLDILNATIGTFMQFGDHITFNTGVGLPLRDEDDRLFDYELQFQLNYYIDGFGGRNAAF